MKEFLCLKDWIMNEQVYYQKGKTYMGKVYNSGKSVEMRGENRMVINFHVGSEYFDIQ